VLKVNELIKIRIQELVNNDGWTAPRCDGFGRIELRPIQLGNGQEFIQLTVDGERIQNDPAGRWRGWWRLVEQENVGQLTPIRLERIHENSPVIRRVSPMMHFFVIGNDGKKTRFLYFYRIPNSNNQFIIGTRRDLNARYASTCRSRYQRTLSHDAQIAAIRKQKRAERAEKNLIKRFHERYS
jgi:hypothetical protein